MGENVPSARGATEIILPITLNIDWLWSWKGNTEEKWLVIAAATALRVYNTLRVYMGYNNNNLVNRIRFQFWWNEIKIKHTSDMVV